MIMVREDTDDILQTIAGRPGSHLTNERRYGVLLALAYLSGLCGGEGLSVCGANILLAARTEAAP